MKRVFIVFTLFIAVSCSSIGNKNIRTELSLCAFRLNEGYNPLKEASKKFLSFYDEKGNIYFIDPKNPSNVLLKDSNITFSPLGPRTVVSGIYDNTTGKITDFDSRYLIYLKNKSIYKLSLLKSDTYPPLKVSSENGTAVICDDTVIPDYENPERSIYIFYSSPDQNCWDNNDVLKLIRLDMGEIDNPISINDKIPLGVFRDSQTLGIRKLIMLKQKNNNLYDLESCAVDINGLTCSSILPAEFASTQGIATASVIANYIYNGQFYTAIVIERKLYIYDGNNMIKPSSTCELPSSNIKVAQDDTSIYIGAGTKIIKFNYSDLTCYILPKEEDKTINQLNVTGNKIVYREGNRLKAIRKDGSSETLLLSTIDTLWIVGTSGNLIFYNIYGGKGYRAGYIKDDGSVSKEFQGAYWGGVLFYKESLPHKRIKHSMLLVSAKGCPPETKHLGTLNKIYRSLYIKNPTEGYFLGKAYYNSVTGDIVMFRSDKENSLVNITDTLEINEYIPR